MRIIECADLHFSSYSQDRIDPKTKLPERLSGLTYAMDDMIRYGRENSIKNIAILGDTLHNKSIIHSIAQSVFLDIVRKNRDIHFIILDGNHDMSSMTGDGVSATKCLDTEVNVTTIHKTSQIENMLFVPWDPNSMINDIKNGKSDYLMAHFGLNEAVVNSGISLVSDIGLNDLKQYKRVHLGHYHTPQSVGNAVYIGSLIHLDGNDKNQVKRFLVVDTNTGEEKSIPSKGYKQYVEIDISKDTKDDFKEIIYKLKQNGDHVKINKIDDVDLSDIEDDFNIVNKVEKDITNRGITSGMSSADKLDRYMEIKEIPAEKRNEYKNIALDIIDKISSEGK